MALFDSSQVADRNYETENLFLEISNNVEPKHGRKLDHFHTQKKKKSRRLVFSKKNNLNYEWQYFQNQGFNSQQAGEQQICSEDSAKNRSIPAPKCRNGTDPSNSPQNCPCPSMNL